MLCRTKKIYCKSGEEGFAVVVVWGIFCLFFLFWQGGKVRGVCWYCFPFVYLKVVLSTKHQGCCSQTTVFNNLELSPKIFFFTLQLLCAWIPLSEFKTLSQLLCPAPGKWHLLSFESESKCLARSSIKGSYD